MNNYYEFNYNEDRESFEYFNSLSNNALKNILDNNFNYIESYLEEFANVFQKIFNGNDFDEFYYICKSLNIELNDIKIILNVLKERDLNE